MHSGQWLLYRFNPERKAKGENPLQLDSQNPRMKVQEYMNLENRFRMLAKSLPDRAREFFKMAQSDADARWQYFQRLAASTPAGHEPGETTTSQAGPETLVRNIHSPKGAVT